jgi:beta-lactamase class A
MKQVILFTHVLACCFMGTLALLDACTAKTAIPTQFPTSEPPPAATPIPAIVLKRDAELEKQFASIAEAAKGKVGAAAVVLETGDAALLNADGHYPMQSVYKLPICMAIMDSIRLGQHDLDEVIGVTPADYVRQGQASEIRDKFPNGGEFTIRDLIRYTLVESDGSASDVILRVMGGAPVVQEYIEQIGIRDMHVVSTEKELGANWDTQYQNWATPIAAVEVLRSFQIGTRYGPTECPPLGEFAPTPTSGSAQVTVPANVDPKIVASANASKRIANPDVCRLPNVVGEDLVDSQTGPNRIKGLLPKETPVAHKTGTGGTQNGITSATNDIGLVDLPNGKHLAVAVFVSDSPADDKTREAVIAKIAKAAYDKWSR